MGAWITVPETGARVWAPHAPAPGGTTKKRAPRAARAPRAPAGPPDPNAIDRFAKHTWKWGLDPVTGERVRVKLTPEEREERLARERDRERRRGELSAALQELAGPVSAEGISLGDPKIKGEALLLRERPEEGRRLLDLPRPGDGDRVRPAWLRVDSRVWEDAVTGEVVDYVNIHVAREYKNGRSLRSVGVAIHASEIAAVIEALSRMRGGAP